MGISVFASDEKEPKIVENNEQNSILVKIEEDDYSSKANKSNFIGVHYTKSNNKWRTQRRSKNEKKMIYNGTYKDEETAARASDTVARKLIASGEKGHKLNFLDDDTEVNPETERENYFGVRYNKQRQTWCASRWSKGINKTFHNGTYKDEETAAHASDTLARKLIANGEKGHTLNYPDDETVVYREKTSNYIGVSYITRDSIWRAERWSKIGNKVVYNGSYKDEKTAAHASDTLARKLIENGEKGHKLNFPDDDTEVRLESQKRKRKRPANFENSQKCGRLLDKFE